MEAAEGVVGLAAVEVDMADTDEGAMIEDTTEVLRVADIVVDTGADQEAMHHTRCCEGGGLILLVMRLSRILQHGRSSTPCLSSVSSSFPHQ